jgi:hypothetical protein
MGTVAVIDPPAPDEPVTIVVDRDIGGGKVVEALTPAKRLMFPAVPVTGKEFEVLMPPPS